MYSPSERKRSGGMGKRINPGGMFDEFDPNLSIDQKKAIQKYHNNDNLTFYDYIWVCDKEDLSSKDSEFNFNYYEEVGKALGKYGNNEELNIMEQILVMMSGDETVETKYPEMKKHEKYNHFWNTIDKWINITDSR